MNITAPVCSPKVLVRHATGEALVCMVQSNIQLARQSQSSVLKAEYASDPSDAELPMKIAILDNKIAKSDYELANETPIDILDSEKMVYGNGWRIYIVINDHL